MTFRHHSAEEVRAAQASHPGCWLVEVITGGAACLIAIPLTAENRARAVPFMAGIDASMLDEASIKTPRFFVRRETHEKEPT